MQTSIIIADDHPLILKGLSDFLTEKNYNIVGSATNGRDALKLIEELKPSLAILDIRMPHKSGLDVAKVVNNRGYATKVILITFEKDEAIYNEAKQARIYGYVLKEFALNEIEACITSVINNTPYFSSELVIHLEPDEVPKELDSLTPTERKVLKLTAKNKTAKEIGDLLFCSNRTVEKHKSNIIKKFNLEPKHAGLSLFAKEIEPYLD